nr:hypothetical protein [Treponema sp. OMZ 803]
MVFIAGAEALFPMPVVWKMREMWKSAACSMSPLPAPATNSLLQAAGLGVGNSGLAGCSPSPFLEEFLRSWCSTMSRTPKLRKDIMFCPDEESFLCKMFIRKNL